MAIKLIIGGGLGNQLFKYAGARAIALRLGTDLIVDFRNYNLSGEHSKRPWILDFPLAARTITYENALLGPHHPLRRVYRRMFSERRSEIVRRTHEGFREEEVDVENGTTLFHLAASHLHFEDRYSEIEQEIDLLKTAQIDKETISRGTRLEEHIGIHVRRGDYLTHKNFSLSDPIGYYTRAIANEQAYAKRPLLVFSDDTEWCRQQSCFESATFFDADETAPPYHDMFAMALCSSLIIANSTFSWWAGWFGMQRGHRIVAPSEWIWGKDPLKMKLYPESWIVV